MDTLYSSDPKNVSKCQIYLSYISCDEVKENSPSKIGLIFRLDVGMPTEVRERSQLKKNVKFYTFGPVDIIIIFTHPR